MKCVKDLTGIVLLTLLLSTSVYAQKGSIGLGLRATPDGGGFNFKAFPARHLAIEAQMNTGGVLLLEGQSFNAVALAEAYIPLPDPSWSIFFGGGMHGGFWDHGAWYRESDGAYLTRPEPIFGIDGIAGVEYRFRQIPLGLSADVKPAVNFVTNPQFFAHNMFGFTARYYLR